MKKQTKKRTNPDGELELNDLERVELANLLRTGANQFTQGAKAVGDDFPWLAKELNSKAEFAQWWAKRIEFAEYIRIGKDMDEDE